MRTITYKQACEVLGVSLTTIQHAVVDGRLTRCFHNTRTAMLLHEQVALFVGKRISENALSLEERDKWKKYKYIAENPELLAKLDEKDTISSGVDKEALDKLIEQAIEEKMKPFLLEQSDRLKREADEAREREERFRKDHPFLNREPIAV